MSVVEFVLHGTRIPLLVLRQELLATSRWRSSAAHRVSLETHVVYQLQWTLLKEVELVALELRGKGATRSWRLAAGRKAFSREDGMLFYLETIR